MTTSSPGPARSTSIPAAREQLCATLRASDLAHLPEEAVALYDDDAAKGERILDFGDRLLRNTQTSDDKVTH
jgi:hypothetical protein